MASKTLSFLPIFLLVAAIADAGLLESSGSGSKTIAGPREIAKILEPFPKFSTLRDLLIQTKLDAEIDSRQSVTLFAVANPAIAHLAKLPLDVQKEVLSVHVVLDYYDLDKITNLPNATALLTTLFQTSGKSAGKSGFLNATYVGDGIVRLGSAEAGLTAEVVMPVAKQPYNISVIEISEVIMPPGIESSATSAPKASQSEETTSASASAPIESSIASAPENLAPGSEAHHSSARRLVLGLGSGVAILVAFFGAL